MSQGRTRTRVWLAAVVLASVVAAGSARAWIVSHSNNSLNPAISPEQFRPAPDGSRPAPGLAPAPLTVVLLPLDPRLDPRIPEAVRRAILKWNQPGSSLVIAAGRVNKEADAGWQSRYNNEDGRNTIEFVTKGWPAFWGSNAIAMTVPHLDGEGRIVEADVFCNAVDFYWSILPEAGADPLAPPGKKVVDAEAVLSHEMGHVVGLGHSERAWAAMYAYADPRSTRARYLTSDDLSGLRFLYPRTAADVPPADLWGVSRESFEDGMCGSSYLTLYSAILSYVDRTVPLPGPHDLVSPPDWPTPYHFCLLGSGFTTQTAAAGLLSGATVAVGATNAEVLGSNFARGSLDDGSSVFPALPDGVYDFYVNQAEGGTATLPQGMFVAPAANALPQALLVARPLAPAGGSVRLDASGSYDPEAAPLTYRYELVESPAPASIVAAGDSARLDLPAAGVYVAQLIVNDGQVDSIADQVVIQAAHFPEGGSTGLAFGCAAGAGRPGRAGLAALLLPLAAGIAASRLVRGRIGRRNPGPG